MCCKSLPEGVSTRAKTIMSRLLSDLRVRQLLGSTKATGAFGDSNSSVAVVFREHRSNGFSTGNICKGLYNYQY